MAYDRIMTFPGRFADHIMPDKIHMLNVSFTVTGVVERPGGCAGNIAYALSLLGEKPVVLACVGRDFQPYYDWLARNGITTEGLRVIDEELTAGAYITTDQADNQITGFNPGAMKFPSEYNLNGIDPANTIAVIAPGNLDDMAAYRKAYVASRTPFIFDPGQSLTMWEGLALAECLTGAKILISNDYELELIQNITGLTVPDLLARVATLITTKGENGSIVITRDGEIPVPAYGVQRVVDPTGAGDAYRGGLVKGLVEGKTVDQAARMGSVIASFAVEVQGTQEYRFTMEEFNRRLQTL